ncbi:hypothetical protein [Mycobacterium sp. DL440]|uniref:hypothetical protein n=1 Tax=Mycobacterium sp. DL440 TaxID=2675523 RepID=UPI001FB9A09F|nr:hypothetical protein [Mycobacterium sp. DL440]
MENTGQVAVTDLVEGDVVLHPERQMWMRVHRVRDFVETVRSFEQATGWTTEESSLRRVTLDPVHRLPIETFIPFDLDYRDAEQLELITRWTGGELPPQAF